jgi:hypothetical protein
LDKGKCFIAKFKCYHEKFKALLLINILILKMFFVYLKVASKFDESGPFLSKLLDCEKKNTCHSNQMMKSHFEFALIWMKDRAVVVLPPPLDVRMFAQCVKHAREFRQVEVTINNS